MKTLSLAIVVLLLLLAPAASAITMYNSTVDGYNVTIINGTAGTIQWDFTYMNIVDSLIIGGGGSSGQGNPGLLGAATGGSGGALNGSLSGYATGIYNITIGAGGIAQTSVNTHGYMGGNTSIANLTYNWTAYGGGYGGANNGDGGQGGSGGGGRTNIATSIQNSQTPLTGYGNSGGVSAGDQAGGGIGGAASGGTAGVGKSFNITGSPTIYAKGGLVRQASTQVKDGFGDGGDNTGDAVGSRRGGNGTVIIKYTLITPPLGAVFIQSPNPSVVGQTVTFTDTSTGSPTTWNWTIGVVVTNTTQNAAYTFPAAGTYPINLNVTNIDGDFSDITHNQVVADASGFNQQDIYMAGEYTLTLTVVDASTSAPIAGANVTDSTGQATTTSDIGVATLAEDAGPIVIYTSADGYYSAISSYVVDSSEAHTIRLTREVAPPSSSVNTLYSPQNVHLTIVDAYGVPQVGALVSVAYIASSLPSTSVNWLISNYGVNESVAGDMVNSAVVQQDYTESTGGFVFTALPVIRYGITATNATTGMNHRVEITPKDSHYTIYCPLTGQSKTNNTLLARQNATLPWYSLNTTHLMLGMTYQDTTTCTNSVLFRVWFQVNGTEVHNTTWTGFGSSLILDNHTIPKAPIGTEYLWQYNATRVC